MGELAHRDDLDLVADQVKQAPTLTVPFTGELVDLNDPNQVGRALQSLDDARRQLDELRQFLGAVLRLEARRQGTKTLHLDGLDAVISGGKRVEYDAVELLARLRGEAIPEGRLAEVVVETVSYKVNVREVNRLVAANPAYAAAAAGARTTVAVPWRVTVKRPPG